MTRSEKVKTAVDTALRRTENLLIALLSLAALVLGTMQVVLRYLFNTGFHWNEAVFVLTTVTAMLAAGSRAVRENAHVRVDLVATLVPGSVSRWLDLLAHLAAFRSAPSTSIAARSPCSSPG